MDYPITIAFSISSMLYSLTTTYAVVYSVEQKISEDKNSQWVRSTYRILFHQDKLENLVITQNPTLWSLPKKSDYDQNSQ
ncbi:conjugal transfer protein [Shouchella clausii]|uniref:conjugal transfer protein n=1 Tax=Shouchella clausii TaxID=79880 RepID=UPI0039839552